MNEAFRLSRIRAPRFTTGAAALLAIVFIVFGLLIYSLAPDTVASVQPLPFDGKALTFTNWLLSSIGVS